MTFQSVEYFLCEVVLKFFNKYIFDQNDSNDQSIMSEQAEIQVKVPFLKKLKLILIIGGVLGLSMTFGLAVWSLIYLSMFKFR